MASHQPSEWLYDFLKQWEQFRPTAYLPTKNDVPTIGYGHTRGVKMGDVCTLQDAEDWLHADVAATVAAVNRLCVDVILKQCEFDAIVSLVFNIGVGAFESSTLLRKLRLGHYDEAQAEFAKWKKQAGKTLPGLVKRRAAEAERFGSTSPPKP